MTWHFQSTLLNDLQISTAIQGIIKWTRIMQFCANDQKWFMRRKYAEIDIEVFERWSEQKKNQVWKKRFFLLMEEILLRIQSQLINWNSNLWIDHHELLLSCDFAPFLNQWNFFLFKSYATTFKKLLALDWNAVFACFKFYSVRFFSQLFLTKYFFYVS